MDDPAQTIARLQAALDQQAKDLVRLNDFLEKRESFIREGMGVFASFHQRALDHQDQERSRFEQELANRTAAIASLTEAIAQRDVAVTRLEGERTGRDAEIARLHSEIAHRDTIRTVLAENLARLQANNDPLRSRTVRRCHRLILFGLKAVDSAWISLVRWGTTPR